MTDYNNIRGYVFFYSDKSGPELATLSQFYPCNFTIAGIQFNCAEQYMMYKKAKTFGDMKAMERILKMSDPKKIKAEGRKVKNFDETIWKDASVKAVYDGNMAKFSQNPELRSILTNNKYKGMLFVEASPRDNVWGIGMSEKTAMKTNPSKWNGQNKLGRILTKVRDDLCKDTQMEVSRDTKLLSQPCNTNVEVRSQLDTNVKLPVIRQTVSYVPYTSEDTDDEFSEANTTPERNEDDEDYSDSDEDESDEEIGYI
ncbi:hypothetical protein D3C87_762510 [compost metagenome]